MLGRVERFWLPDTLAAWPWPRRIHPDYEEAKAASEAWVESFGAFSPKAQKAFNGGDFSLLGALAYPLGDKERLRSICDIMNLFFVFDEYSDVETEHGVRKQASIIMDAFRNPYKPRPVGECIVGEITRQCWERSLRTLNLSRAAHDRFLHTFSLYLDACAQQAEDRTRAYIRGIDSYLSVRRNTIGGRPSFALLESDLDIPDEVLSHPLIIDLSTAALDMIILANDILSYNVEQARGDDGHNIIAIVMHELDTDVHGAMQWAGVYHEKRVVEFMTAKKRLPSWGKGIDDDVAIYVDGLANWVRANDSWSFESQRYFGKKGLAIQKTRRVVLLPKVQFARCVAGQKE